MSSGTLTSQSHISIPTSSQDFATIIKTICQSYRLTGLSIKCDYKARSRDVHRGAAAAASKKKKI